MQSIIYYCAIMNNSSYCTTRVLSENYYNLVVVVSCESLKLNCVYN